MQCKIPKRLNLNFDQNSSSYVSCDVSGLIDGATVKTVRDWIKSKEEKSCCKFGAREGGGIKVLHTGAYCPYRKREAKDFKKVHLVFNFT